MLSVVLALLLINAGSVGAEAAKVFKDARLSLVKPDDIIGLVSTEHLNSTHGEVVDAVKNSLMDVGIPKENIVMAQGGLHKPKACTALIALPALNIFAALYEKNRSQR